MTIKAIQVDAGLEITDGNKKNQYRLLTPSNEADRNKMNAVFMEAGIIWPNMEEFVDVFRKQGICFVIEEPKPDYEAKLREEGFTLERDGSEIKITNSKAPEFLFCVMFDIDLADYNDIKSLFEKELQGETDQAALDEISK